MNCLQVINYISSWGEPQQQFLLQVLVLRCCIWIDSLAVTYSGMRLRGVYENLFGDFPIGSGSETAPLIFSASLGATVIRDFQFPTWAEGRPGLSLRTGPGRFGDPVTLSPARDCCPTLAARSLAVDRARALRRPGNSLPGEGQGPVSG